MKYNRKCLFSLFALVFLFSCAGASQQNVSEERPALTADLAAEKGKASVVRLTGGNLTKIGAGSGFFVQPDKIATNLHVVARPGPIFAKLSDDETIWMVEGVAAYDMENDLIVLKIAGEGVPLSVGNSDAVRNGEPVYAIGYPGGGAYKLTAGTIHSRQYKNKWLQTTAEISQGNSGGPMLNGKGEVIGINTAVDDTYSYAVPSNTLKALLSVSTQVEPLLVWYKQKRIRAYHYREIAEGRYNDNYYRAAIADLDKSIELDPEYPPAYMMRGHIASHYAESIVKYGNRANAQVHYDTAINDYTEAIKLDPEDAEGYNGRGHTRCHYGEYEAKRGNAAEALKHYQMARKDYNKAIKLEPDDGEHYNGRGWARYLLGQLNSEQEEFRSAEKQYQAAIKAYTKAIKLEPEVGEHYCRRRRNGRRQHAVALRINAMCGAIPANRAERTTGITENAPGVSVVIYRTGTVCTTWAGMYGNCVWMRMMRTFIDILRRKIRVPGSPILRR